MRAVRAVNGMAKLVEVSEPAGDWPVLEDPGAYGYYREEGGGLMIGLFEPVCAPWKIDGAPTDAPYLDLEPDWEREQEIRDELREERYDRD